MYKRKYVLETLRTKRNGKIIVMPYTFKDIKVIIEDIEYSFNYENDKLNILLESNQKNNVELDEKFFILYEYINIVIGYYPGLLSVQDFNIEEIAEKYKTSEKHIIMLDSFIKQITSSIFEESYKKFLYLWEKACFSINYYSITISKIEEHYSEISIVNILQCLDGIYDILEIIKINRKYLTGSEAKKVRNEVNNIKIENIDDNKKEILEKQLKEAVGRIEYYNYENKLRNIFDFIDKYNIFKLEKKQKEEDKKFDEFIMKCKKKEINFHMHLIKVKIALMELSQHFIYIN